MTSESKQCAVCNRVFSTEHDFLTGTSRWRVCSQGNLWFNCSCNSTLLIKKGKFDWYSPEAVLKPDARSVFNQLGNLKTLPHIPSIAFEIQKVLEDPNVAAKDIATLLRREPVMATEILQVAENLRTSRNPTTPKITSIEHAVVYIGFKALGEIVLTTSPRIVPLPASSFNADEFWKECFVLGTIAEYVGHRYANYLNRDDLFLAGSLCNIGKLVTAFCFSPLLTKIERDVSGRQPPLLTWRQAEQSYAFPDHCILGEIAASIWGFPLHIGDASRFHHTELEGIQTKLTIQEICAFANQMCHWVLSRPHRMEYQIIESFAKRMRLADSDIEKLAQELTILKNQIYAPSKTT